MGQKWSKTVLECLLKLLDTQSYLISDIDSLFEAFYWNNWNYFVRDSNNHSKAKAKKTTKWCQITKRMLGELGKSETASDLYWNRLDVF